MPTGSIIINKDLDKTFNLVLNKFKEDMNIKSLKANEVYKTSFGSTTITGKPLDIKQEFSFNPEEYTIEISNTTAKTKSVSTFKFSDVKGDTNLFYSEFPSGSDSVRTLNYLMFELPLFNRSTKKKINVKLTNIKALVENS